MLQIIQETKIKMVITVDHIIKTIRRPNKMTQSKPFQLLLKIFDLDTNHSCDLCGHLLILTA